MLSPRIHANLPNEGRNGRFHWLKSTLPSVRLFLRRNAPGLAIAFRIHCKRTGRRLEPLDSNEGKSLCALADSKSGPRFLALAFASLLRFQDSWRKCLSVNVDDKAGFVLLRLALGA